MERVRAGLRGDVDQRRRLAAELRRIHRLLDLELLDRIDRRVDDEIVEQLVGHLGAVEQIDVVPGSLAADVRQRARLLQRLAARSARRHDHRIAQLRESQKVSAVERKLNDLAVLDDVADFGVRRLEERRVDCDRDLLGEALRRRA